MVANLARPGGNITGFSLYEYGLSGKSLELLKQISPPVTRVAVLRGFRQPRTRSDSSARSGRHAARSNLVRAPLDLPAPRRPTAIRSSHASEGALFGCVGHLTDLARIYIGLAARHQLPVVCPDWIFVTDGGLVSYGPDRIDQYRRAAEYIDRILKGEKPADLPVQTPTKYELVINLKTAKAMGLTIPPSVLARANEVIE